jgi:hypothetical protein
MNINEVIDALPPLVLAEPPDASRMTNAKRLQMTSMPIAGDLITLEREPHPRDYIRLTGDSSDYQLCVALGQGVHGKGAKLFKSPGGYIRRVRENVRSLLRFVSPPEFATFLETANLTQEEFVARVKDLPSALSD